MVDGFENTVRKTEGGNMNLSQAYAAAKSRAWCYGGEDCTAYWAWSQVAKRRRSRVTHWDCFFEAMQDAIASEDSELILAIEKIVDSQASRCEKIGTPKAIRIANNLRNSIK